jgi:hypothetical protein
MTPVRAYILAAAVLCVGAELFVRGGQQRTVWLGVAMRVAGVLMVAWELFYLRHGGLT